MLMRGGKAKKEQKLSAYLKNVHPCTYGMKSKLQEAAEELIRTDTIVNLSQKADRYTARSREMSLNDKSIWQSELRYRIRGTTHLEWKTGRR